MAACSVYGLSKATCLAAMEQYPHALVGAQTVNTYIIDCKDQSIHNYNGHSIMYECFLNEVLWSLYIGTSFI